MRLILEAAEIIKILGVHFQAELDPKNVIIRTDPFEIEVCALPLSESAEAEDDNVVALPQKAGAPRTPRPPRDETAKIRARDDEGATAEPPPPGNDGNEGPEQDLHPAAILAASKDLERELDKENPQLTRRSGRWSHTPPPLTDDEIS